MYSQTKLRGLGGLGDLGIACVTGMSPDPNNPSNCIFDEYLPSSDPSIYVPAVPGAVSVYQYRQAPGNGGCPVINLAQNRCASGFTWGDVGCNELRECDALTGAHHGTSPLPGGTPMLNTVNPALPQPTVMSSVPGNDPYVAWCNLNPTGAYNNRACPAGVPSGIVNTPTVGSGVIANINTLIAQVPGGWITIGLGVATLLVTMSRGR